MNSLDFHPGSTVPQTFKVKPPYIILATCLLIFLAASFLLIKSVPHQNSTGALNPVNKGLSPVENATGPDLPRLPDPQEYLVQLDKRCILSWPELYRPTDARAIFVRDRAAFLLGMALTESHLAIAAQDQQQLRNFSQDIATHAKVLGLSIIDCQTILQSNKAETDEDWAKTKISLGDIQRQFKNDLQVQHDYDMICLMDLGLWNRLLSITATAAKLDEECLDFHVLLGDQRPQIIEGLKYRSKTLSAKTQEIPWIIGMQNALERVDWLLSPRNADSPSRHAVKETCGDLNDLLNSIVAAVLRS